MDEIVLLAAGFSEKSFEDLKEIVGSDEQPIDPFLASGSDHIIETIVQHTPDIILVNSNNPLIDPISVIKHINELESGRKIPIILATDNSSNTVIEEAFQNGIIDFITFPFRREELLHRIKIAHFKNDKITQLGQQCEQLKQLSYVATKTSNSVAIINPEGKIEWVNKGFTDMYEYSFEEFKRKFEGTLFNPKFNTSFNKALHKSVYDKNNVVYENRWFTKTGKEKWVQTTLTPIFDETTRKVTKLIAIETDITDLKKAEKRLEEKNNNLLKTTKRIETTNEILENQRIELENEKQRSENLLLNILPYATAQQLKRKGESKLRSYKRVTVMFADFQSFTKLSEKISNEKLISELNDYFGQFDEIITQHHIEKIKTMGDCYMCAGGIPLSNKSNPIDVTLAGLQIQEYAEKIRQQKEKENLPSWELRVGLHTGEVIAGVIGKKKFAYDIWGDTVNTASRMETSGETGKVNVSGDTYQFIKDYFDCTYRGKIQVKYKGQMEMYFVNRLKQEYSQNEEGTIPNETFMKILSSY